MKRYAVSLFFIGLFLEMCGFAVSNAVYIPGVRRLIAPAHHQAQQALSDIESGSVLGPKDSGFGQLVELAATVQSTEASKLQRRSESIQHIRMWFPDSTIENLGVPKEHFLVFNTASAESPRLRRDEVSELIAEGILRRAFCSGAFVFVVGFALQLLGFTGQCRSARSRKGSAAHQTAELDAE